MNGAEVLNFRKKQPPGSCPFCGKDGEVMTVNAPTGQVVFGVQCPGCGILGPPGSSEDEAVKAWNTRHGDPASLAFGAKTEPETCAAAAVVMDLSRKLYANELGPIQAFVLLMVSGGLQPKIGIHVHALNKKGAWALCNAAGAQLGQPDAAPTSPGGIILPGQV